MRISVDGQVTIPAEIRDALGLASNTEVEFEVDGDALLILKADRNRFKRRCVVKHLRGSGDVPMSTDEILRLTRQQQ